MENASTNPLNPLSFLQAFISQSIRVAEQHTCGQIGAQDHIERVGLAASACLEEGARNRLGHSGTINTNQYAEMIVDIKNRIGGDFSCTSAASGVVRVVSTTCPFGKAVKDAPELCRMTASVFGGIAARNFGYGKVELTKRIALGDDHCEVSVYLDPVSARDKPGDEYRSEGDKIVSTSSSAEARARVEAKLRKVWCADGETKGRGRAPTIIAESRAMREALRAVEIVAPTVATVLITGETGVGKEVIARAIHALSDRADRELVTVNCGAIPDNLVESALFGHDKGAFTNAYSVHHGYFERANHGTLFLDEIDCLSLSAHPRLLRVLQEGEFERVGGRETLRSDVRIIAASNQNLKKCVEEGRFRLDLFYRLNVVPIWIPPLRDRPDDIVALANNFLRQLAEKYARGPKVLGDSAWKKLLRYPWPGNLREMENVLERAFLFANGSVIDTIEIGEPDVAVSDEDETTMSLKQARQRAVRDIEAKAIVDAMKRFHGNVSAVADAMALTPRAIYLKLRSLNINAAAFRGQHDGSYGGEISGALREKP